MSAHGIDELLHEPVERSSIETRRELAIRTEASEARGVSSTYPATLFLHSWLRWFVLALLFITLWRAVRGWRTARAADKLDERALRALLAVFDVQLLLGLWLYFVASPIANAFLANPKSAMGDSVLRFFGMEHITMMLLAAIALHTGRVLSRRKTEPKSRHRSVFTWTLTATLLALAGTPWPFLKAGRPLLRTSVDGAENDRTELAARSPGTQANTCPPEYVPRCSACHGISGRGDGVASRSLNPPPRDFADPSWGMNKTDAELARVIHEGGAAHGFSAAMPAHPDLSVRQVDALVACLRSFSRGPASGSD